MRDDRKRRILFVVEGASSEPEDRLEWVRGVAFSLSKYYMITTSSIMCGTTKRCWPGFFLSNALRLIWCVFWKLGNGCLRNEARAPSSVLPCFS